MNLLHQFKEHLQKEFSWINRQQYHFLLAVSGGVDSVVLTDLFVRCGLQCSIAHCNFQLRGAESERDAVFVKKMAEQFGLAYIEKKFDTNAYAAAYKLSVQEAARELRYNWFEKMRSEIEQPALLVTAHHADDNLETAIMHFFRGTGISGLTGIKKYDKGRHLLRPLLGFPKSALRAYATEEQLQFVEDSSNESDKYTRNYFRHQILSAVETVFPTAAQNILKNIERLAEVSAIYHQSIAAYKEKITRIHGNSIVIPINALQKFIATRSLLWEIVKEYHFTEPQLNEIIKLFTANNSSYIVSQTHRIIKERASLIITSLNDANAGLVVIEKDTSKILFDGGELHAETLGANEISFKVKPAVLLTDPGLLSFPLTLRKWQTGDYFYPFGLNKKKKISRFLIDEKLSMVDKENTWVLLSGKKIIWVVGKRADNRYRIDAKTKHIIKITFIATAR